MALLADLLCLPCSERCPLPNLSPQRKKEQTLWALIRQLEGLSRQQPVVMVFEDAHWIDATSRELLDLTIERISALSLSVLLIVTFRSEFQTPWTGQPHVTVLALNRLDRHDRTALVEQIAGSKALPNEVIDQIADRTDGVPLFVEELTKSVLESGVPLVGIPTTLHDSLMARLDRLSSVRRVAQIGAAIGREFSYALLHAVSRLPEDELQASLDRLVASELVFQRGMPPDAVYLFKHALVQDAAHDSLLRSSRQQLHAQIAEALETHSPELMETQPELFAHLAQRFDEDLLRLSRKRNDSAGLVLGHACSGRNLMFVGRFASSRSHLEAALTLYDPISHSSLSHQAGFHPEVFSQAFLEVVLFCAGHPDQALALGNAPGAEARRLVHPPSLAVSLALGARLLWLLSDVGDNAALEERAGKLIAVATEQGFPHYLALGAIHRGWVKVRNGDVVEGISLLRSGSASYAPPGPRCGCPIISPS